MRLTTLILLTGFAVMGITACSGVPGSLGETDELIRTLEARVEELEERLQEEVPEAMEDLEGLRPGTASFDLAVAQYIMDTADFHGIDVSIKQNDEIDPSFLSTVTRVHKVMVGAPWPHDLQEEAAGFIVLLEAFMSALGSNDVETASELADEVHGAQHNLSRSIDNWFGSAGPSDDDHHDEGDEGG